MNLFLWMCKGIHIVSAVGWIGGIGFLNGVASPVFAYLGATSNDANMRIQRRFTGFVWMCAWGLGVSGVVLMLMSGQFLWFDFSTPWRAMLLAKQILFLVMIAASLVVSRSLNDLAAATSEESSEVSEDNELSDRDRLAWRIAMLNRITMLCGIAALLLAAAM